MISVISIRLQVNVADNSDNRRLTVAKDAMLLMMMAEAERNLQVLLFQKGGLIWTDLES
jgi:hypothetical protein